MMAIIVNKSVGTFAENKDAARDLRVNKIMPTLKMGKEVVIDFSDVTGATQSFIHALISEAIRQYRETALDLISFKNCSPAVKEVVMTVVEYMQES